jgi:type I restriction enzyme S subunit
VATWRRALLKAAVTGELTANWRTSNPPTETGDELLSRVLADRRIRWEAAPKNKGKVYAEPIGPEGDNLPALHPGWAWVSLAQIASEQERSFQSGPFGSALLHSEFQDTGHLVIGIDNVQQGYFSKGADHRISEEKFQELRRFQARPKDVLITVMATIGRTCVVPEDVEDAIVTKHLYRITTAKNVADPTFVSTCLRASPSTVNYLFGNTLGQTRPGLNKSILERAPVPIAPIAEQKRALQIVAEQIEGTSAILDDLKGCSATLRQSILAAAFRGDLV